MSGYASLDVLERTPGGKHLKPGFGEVVVGRFQVSEKKSEALLAGEADGASASHDISTGSDVPAESGVAEDSKPMLPLQICCPRVGGTRDVSKSKSGGGQTPGSVVSSNGTRVHFPPGLLPPPNTPSHGSALHALGTCKPCAWFWKPSGCENGQDCMHCHLCKQEEMRARKKSRAAMMRLGLATPKPQSDDTASALLAMSMVSLKLEEKHQNLDVDFALRMHSDQCSTVTPTSLDEHSEGSRGETPLLPFITPAAPGPSPCTGGSSVHGFGLDNTVDDWCCYDLPPGAGKDREHATDTMMRLGLATPKTGPAMPSADHFSMGTF